MMIEGRHPWFSFYALEWLLDEDVTMMTLAAQGLYMRLLCLQWKHVTLPRSTDKLARLSGVGLSDFIPLWEEVSGKFPQCPEDETRCCNLRLEEERKGQELHFATQKRNGAKGGRPRKSPPDGPEPGAKATGNPEETHGFLTVIPQDNPRETQLKAIKNKKEIQKEEQEKVVVTPPAVATTSGARESNAAMLLRLLGPDHSSDALTEWVGNYFAMRRAKRYGRLTDSTIEQRAKEYKLFPVEVLVQAFKEASLSEWRGVFPEKVKLKRSSPSQQSTETVEEETQRILRQLEEAS